MASVYPNAVDNFTDPLANSPLNSPSHAQLHTDVNDALEKIETFVPRKNLLYNGAMQVHQRGTSTTGITTAGYYTADRWRTDLTSLGIWTQTIENDAPTGSGFRKSLKWACTTADASPAAGDLLAVNQLIEGQDIQSVRKGTSSAQQLTVSFWVKSNITGTYIFELYDNDNARQCSKSYTISAANTWEFKTVLIPADTTGAFDNDNALSLYVVWWLGAGSAFTSGTLNTVWAAANNANRAVGQVNLASAINNYWQITGVQLNVGNVPAPFEFKSYGQELLECQRYFFRFGGTPFFPICISNTHSTTQGRCYLPFPTVMRKDPTAISIIGSAPVVGVGTYTSLLFDRASNAGAMPILNGTGFTAGGSNIVYGNGDATTFVSFDVEL